MAEQGFELNIEGLQEGINKVDKSIKSLATTTRNSTNKMIQSISEVITKGFGALENKANELNKTLSNVGGGSNNKGLKNVTDDVVKLTNAMAQSKPKEDLGLGNIQKRLNELLPQLAKAREDITMYKQAIGSGKKTYIEWGQTGLKEAEQRAESLMRQIQALQNSYNSLKNSTANIKNILGDNLEGDKDKLRRQQTKDFYKQQDEENKKRLKEQADEEKRRLKEQKENEKEAERIRRESIRQQKEDAKEQTRITKQQEKNLRDVAKAQKEAEYKRNTSFSGAMAYSKQTKTINDQIKAIQYLKIARDNLDKSKLGAKEYENRVKQINKEIVRQQNEVKRLQGQTVQSFSQMSNVASQLQSRLATVFGIAAIRGYINQLIKVRGEFEMQQRSLEVLLQNKDKADKLWQQTVDLAVKSPFTTKQLITYTKQLAAYRIESEKLFETNKMLADVSAGLDVDMQRLILAFGQVKAANFLRGTELRQFSEAGVNMLEELAKRFTILEQKEVSVGEVFERISKRKVLFEDVEAVFKTITSEGGTFYQMQEKQSETLKGMILNLKDSVELMLNSIGEANDGILKFGVGTVKSFVENWEAVATTIKALIAAFALYKLNILLTSDAVKLLAIDMGVLTSTIPAQLTVVQLLKTGWLKFIAIIKSATKAMWAFISTNPLILAITAALAALIKTFMTWREHKKEIEEIENKYKDLNKAIVNLSNNMADAKLSGDIKEQKTQLLELIALAKKDYSLEFDIDTKNLNEEEIAEKYNEIYNNIQENLAFSEEFEKSLSVYNRWTIADDLNEDFIELGNSATELNKTFFNNVGALKNYVVQVGKYSNEFKDSLKARDVAGGETELDYLERLKKAYNSVVGEYGTTIEQIDNLSKKEKKNLKAIFGDDLFNVFELLSEQLEDLKDKEKEAKEEYEDFIKNIDIPDYLTKEQKEQRLKIAIDKAYAANQWSEFERDYIVKWLNEDYNLEIGFKPKTNVEKDLAPWAKRVKDKIIKVNEKIGNAGLLDFINIPKVGQEMDNFIKDFEDTMKKNKEIIEASKVEGQVIFTQEEIKNAVKLQPYLDETAKYLAIVEKSKKSGGAGKDWYLELAKGLESVHKDFLTLNKDLDKTRAKELALAKNIEVLDTAFTNAGIGMDEFMSSFDLTTEEGFIASLDDLINIVLARMPAKAQETKIALEKILSNIKGEAEISVSIENREVLDEYFDNMFRNYELTMEVENMGLNSDWFADLFNFEKTDLDKIRRNIQNTLGLDGELLNDTRLFSEIGKSNLPEETQKMLRGYLTKIMDEDAKALEESMKKFMEYSKNALSSVGQIRVAESQELTRINSIIDKEIEKAGDDTKKLEELEHLRKHLSDGIKNKAESDVDKALWEEFKGSEGFIRIFQDAEYVSNKAINNMLLELEKFKDSMSDMNVDEIKAIVDAMEKLESMKMERHPMVEMFKSIKDFIKNKDIIQGFSIQGNQQYGISDVPSGGFRSSKDLTKSIQQYEEAIKDLEDKRKKAAENGETEEVASIDNVIKKLKEEKEVLDSLYNDSQSSKANILEGFMGGLDKLQKGIGIVKEAKSHLENMGISFSQGFDDALDTASEIFNGVSAMAEGIMSGNYLQAIMGLLQTLGAIFQIGDKKKERQIQDNIKAIEKLGKAYEKLEKKIEEAYSIDTLQSATNSAMDNLEQQIKKQEEIIALEEAKKKNDEDKLEKYNDQLVEQKEQLEELKKEVISKATDGAFDDVLSAADGFVDAWLEAFKETGDGLKGLEDNFNEMMLNIVKRQASLQIVGVFTDKWKKELEKYVNADDTELTIQEAHKFADAVKADMPELSEALKAYFEAMQGVVDLDGSGDTMSGLQRGVTEITEETAGIIAALLESIRFGVFDRNTKLEQFLNSYNANLNTALSPILSQLQLIVANTDAINSLLERATGTHPSGGRAFKIIM